MRNRGQCGVVGFVVGDYRAAFVAAGGSHFIDVTVPMAELKTV